ncbi:MAG: 3-isopropylmalate dehydratase small subunit [Candidatus Aenigmatarchaeota archaeon]
MKFEGNAHVYGKNTDTDVIIPAACLKLDDKKEMSKHAMEGIDPQFTKRVRDGDIVIGGENFGCGSSREQAPMVLSMKGIGAVVAPSYASIFKNNSVEGGYLYPLICKEEIKASMGDRIRIDTNKHILENLTNGSSYEIEPLTEKEEILLKNKGLIEYTKKLIRERK